MDFNLPSPTHGDPYTVPSSVSGKQLEPKLLPIGPNPHMVQSIPEVREQRLRKKISKLTQARDHWKSEFDKLSYILRMFPYSTARSRWEEIQKRDADRKRLAELEVTQKLLVDENEKLKKQVEALQKIADAHEFP